VSHRGPRHWTFHLLRRGRQSYMKVREDLVELSESDCNSCGTAMTIRWHREMRSEHSRSGMLKIYPSMRTRFLFSSDMGSPVRRSVQHFHLDGSGEVHKTVRAERMRQTTNNRRQRRVGGRRRCQLQSSPVQSPDSSFASRREHSEDLPQDILDLRQIRRPPGARAADACHSIVNWPSSSPAIG